MTAYDAYRTALSLANHGLLDSDAVTHADIDAAADQTGTSRPTGSDERNTVRLALDTIGDSR